MSLLSWVGQEGAVWHHLSAYLTADLEARLESPRKNLKDLFGYLPKEPEATATLPPNCESVAGRVERTLPLF